jgi:hypothetical protein
MCSTTSGPINFFEINFHYVAQADLFKLRILLPSPPECWDYRCGTLCPTPRKNKLKYWYLNTGPPAL